MSYRTRPIATHVRTLDRWSVPFWLGFVATLAIGAIAPLAAQEDDEEDDPRGPGLFAPAPGNVRNAFQRAKAKLDDKKIAEAAVDLAGLIADPTVEDHFIGARKDIGKTSLRGECLRLLKSIPPAELVAIENAYGEVANVQLKQALEAGSREQLEDVARRFLFTRAGLQACLLSGRRSLERGEPMAAALQFSRALELPDAAAKHEPNLSLLTASAWLFAGDSAAAKDVLERLAKKLPEAKTQIDGALRPIFPEGVASLEVLTKWIGEPKRAVDASNSHPMHLGDPARAAVASDVDLHRFPLWRTPTAVDPTELRVAADLRREMAKSQIGIPTALSPLVVGDLAVVRTLDRVMGVDLRNGRRVWSYPWDNQQRTLPPAYVQFKGPDPLRRFVEQRVWDDAVFGRLSSDGRRVFLVDGLQYFSPSTPMGRMGMFRFRFEPPRDQTNQLKALDIAQQGGQAWSIGGPQGDDEPRFAGAFFLGPPLPVAGELYAIADIRGQISLNAIDPATGALRWRQTLIQRDMDRLDDNERLAGASPSFAGGVLVCPTSMGVVVAVDLATRSLRWAATYSANDFVRGGRILQPTVSRWSDSSIVIRGKHVLVAPADGQRLHCFDLLTGESKWNRERRNDHWLVPVAGETKFVTGGESTLRCWNVADGKEAWPNPVYFPGRAPLGQGVASADGKWYFQPVTPGEIWKIDVERGVVVENETLTVDGDLGSLVFAGDHVLSQSPEGLTCFARTGPLRKRVERELAGNPKAAWALAKSAELSLAAGDLGDALAKLDRAAEVDDAQAPIARTALVRTLTESLKRDFAGSRDKIERLGSLLASREERWQFLELLANGYSTTGAADETFATLLEMARMLAEEPHATLSGVDESVDAAPDWQVDRTRWVGGRMAEAARAATPERSQSIATAIRTRTEKLIADRAPIEELARWRRVIGWHPAARALSLHLGERHLLNRDAPKETSSASRGDRIGNLLEAEQCFLPLVGRGGFDPATEREALARAYRGLAIVYESARLPDEARASWLKAAEFGAGVTVTVGKGPATAGLDIAETARRALASARAASTAFSPPAGKVKVDERDHSLRSGKWGALERVTRIDVVQATDDRARRMRVAWDKTTLVVNDSLGREVFSTPWAAEDFRGNPIERDAVAKARFHGRLLVVTLGHEMIGVDLLQTPGADPKKAIRWRLATSTARTDGSSPVKQANYNTIRNPLVGALTVRPTDPQHNTLIGAGCDVSPWGVVGVLGDTATCVDPLTGAVAWRRSRLPRGCDVLSDGERVYLCPPNSKVARIFRIQDGSEAGTVELPSIDERWTTADGKLLSLRTSPEKADESQITAVKGIVQELATGKTLWQFETKPTSRACLIENQAVALVDAEGSLTIREISTGEVVLDAKIEKPTALSSLAAIASSDQWLMFVGRDDLENTTEAGRVRPGKQTESFSGWVHSFGRATGQPTWAGPAKFVHQGFTDHQPVDAPIFTFARLKGEGRRGRRDAEVTIVDRRNGSVLVATRGEKLLEAPPAIEVDPKTAQAYVSIRAETKKTVTLTFTDEAAPEAPPHQEEDQSR
jgi:outer membrane protein assembly factor BamB